MFGKSPVQPSPFDVAAWHIAAVRMPPRPSLPWYRGYFAIGIIACVALLAVLPLHQIARVWWNTLPKKQTSRSETVECGSQVRLRLASHRSQQGMSELSSNHCSDLRHLLSGTEPVEPCH